MQHPGALTVYTSLAFGKHPSQLNSNVLGSFPASSLGRVVWVSGCLLFEFAAKRIDFGFYFLETHWQLDTVKKVYKRRSDAGGTSVVSPHAGTRQPSHAGSSKGGAAQT